MNVLENTVAAAALFLFMGKSIWLGNLGILWIILKGKGAENPKDYSDNLIDRIKVGFTPSMKFRRELKSITYER